MPFLAFNNAEHYYEDAGEGRAFVMIHAGIAHSAMWDPQFEHFASQFRVVRYDQRGFGRTVTRTREFNRRADLLALLDHLKIERAILMGCSMGGALALDFALEHPERVAALILIAAGVSGAERDPEIVKQWDEQDAAFEAGDLERVVELECQMWVDGPGRKPEQVNPAVRARVHEMELENLKIDTEGYESAPLEPPAIGRLKEVQAPTLIILGMGDQPSVIETGQLAAREIPHAQLLELEGAGHVPSMEKAGEVNRAVEGFLEKAHSSN